MTIGEEYVRRYVLCINRGVYIGIGSLVIGARIIVIADAPDN